jgi:hypothetical protein
VFQVSDSNKVYGPFSSRPVAREFVRIMAISTGQDATDYQIKAV